MVFGTGRAEETFSAVLVSGFGLVAVFTTALATGSAMEGSFVHFACDLGLVTGFATSMEAGRAIGGLAAGFVCDLALVAAAVLLLADACVLGLDLAEASETHYASKYDDEGW